MKSDDFKNKMSDKIAKKIPNYPKFGDKEQKVLAKDIIDMIANELTKTENENTKIVEKSSKDNTLKEKKLVDKKAAAEAKMLADKKDAEAKRIADKKVMQKQKG